jgi:hypothetical protein
MAPILAVMAALLVVGAAVPQPPDQKRESPQVNTRPAPLTSLTVDDIVERIMSFDQDKKGKVTRDDLPERMQFLIDRGDTNKDGALDKEEIRNLATKLAPALGGLADRDQVRVGKGGRPNGFSAGSRPVPGGSARFGIDFGPDTNVMERVVDDLKLSGGKKDLAMAAVKAHQDSVRKLMDQARAELLQKMKEILSEEELNDFKAALVRPRGGSTIIAPPGLQERIP